MNLRPSIQSIFTQNGVVADAHGIYDVSVDTIASLATNLYGNEQLLLLSIVANDQRNDGKGFCIYYSFGDPIEHTVMTLRITLGDATEFPSIVDGVHEASWYEKEIYTLFGLTPIGHPHIQRVLLHENWPADVFPLRKDFDGTTRPETAHETFEFSVVEGEGIFEVPVGPIHAGIIEPGHFRFSMAGEEILQLEARLGWVHKGIEKLFETLPLDKKVTLSERISGYSSIGHSFAFCQGVELMAGVAISARAQHIRVLCAELERLANHMNDIGLIMLGTAYNFGSSQLARIRERVMQLNEMLTGSRYMRGMMTLGGVSKDISDATLADTQKELESIKKDFDDVMKICRGNITMTNRMEGSGTIDKEAAIDHGVQGLAAKAMGLARDARKEFPYSVYGDLQFEIPTQETGDVYARWMVRVLEVPEIFNLLKQVITSMPSGSVSVSIPTSLPANAISYGITEGWRGTIVHTILTNNKGEITRVQVRDPSFLNWHAVKYAVKGNVILDFPLINKSFNLSYSGYDR